MINIKLACPTTHPLTPTNKQIKRLVLSPPAFFFPYLLLLSFP